MNLLFLLVTFAVAPTWADLFSHPKLVLPTTDQEVNGKYVEHAAVFHGVPYATPPLGDLRFAPPQALDVESQTDPIDATHYPSMCPQFSFTKNIHLGNEDCLYLSVYVPKNKDSGFNNNKAFPPPKPLPVMFWIFGGAFVLGDNQEFGWYDGENLAHNEDVIVVAANYRVGAFGFLAHEAFQAEGDSKTVGNYGIQDQRMALQWIQDNIAAFGGDPEKVTIFGQSAGGMSVCTLFSNPVNEGLFHGAIMQSGTCNSPEFYQTLPNALDFGHTYSEIVGCDPRDEDNYISCMRGKSTSEIMYGIFKAWEDFRHAQPEITEVLSNSSYVFDEMVGMASSFLPVLAPLMPFGPVIDGVDVGMPLLPYDGIEKGLHNKVPFMAGTTSNEGSIFLPMIPSIMKGVSHLPLVEDEVGPILHHVLDPIIGVDGVDDAIPDLLQIYDINDFDNVDAQLSRILRDYMFTCSTRRAVREASEAGGDVFMYQFNYMNKWLDFKVMGDYHTSELYFVFDNPWPPIVHHFSKDDKKVVSDVQSFWGNFAKNGDPNGENAPIEWSPWTAEGEEYLELNLPSVGKAKLAVDPCDYHDKILGYE
ncbi:hypothetical protein TrLO_g2725 [Triparma laevis f. longispina]|uniref:Carboxylic ester hydrolase n=1 Tax=Triparma laevis f. longispina TaxID=1714387 RepID=A0A9W7KXV3_9STRA|nr:hypothetical protein TrLO_g2725 [Triparma laevis f. longispina]